MRQTFTRGRSWALALLAAFGLSPAASSSRQATQDGAHGPTLEETRLTMGKWIETQQILARERNDWQQGKEILLGRLALVKTEVGALQEKLQQAQASVEEANEKRDEMLAEKAKLTATGAQLAEAVKGMEGEVRRLFPRLPEMLQTTLQPLYQRIPQEPANTRASVAERFQNVLGILKLVNEANGELEVNYEVRTLADGKPTEVRALYIGLAQAYYVSASGEAGVGRPGTDGWQWEPSKALANDVLTALEIMQGKHSPAFVPLPVHIQ